MFIKDTVPIEAKFRRVAGQGSAGALNPPDSRRSGQGRFRAVGLYVLVFCIAVGALALTALLTDSPSARAFQRPVAQAREPVNPPIEIGVSEEDLSKLQRISPASGTPAEPEPVASASGLPAPVVSTAEPPPAPVSPPQPASAPLVPAHPVAVPPSDQGASQGSGVTVPPGEDKEEIYYDSLPLPPSGAMAKTAGPRKVDPTLEPAQKFVIVKKTQDSGGLESLLVSANRALALGRYDAALDMFTHLYRKNPRDARILMGRAAALQHAGRREAAISAYDDVLKVDPSSVEAKINKAGLVGVQYPAVALRDLLALRDKHPGHSGLAAQIGLMQARLGNDAEAIQYLGSAASLEPRNASHIYNMAVIADRMGDRVKAIGLYEQALQLDGGDTQGVRVNRDAVYARLSVLREGKK